MADDYGTPPATCLTRTEHFFRVIDLDDMEQTMNALERGGWTVQIEEQDEEGVIPSGRAFTVWGQREVCACSGRGRRRAASE